MVRARAAVFALAASFSVYLIPLIGPHAQWLLGEVLLQREPNQPPQWVALNWAVALLVQLLVFGLFYWLLRKPGWRRAVPLALIFPFCFPLLQYAYLAAIPTMFLEEPDVAAEKIAWPTVCTAPGVYQTDLKTRSELWVRYPNAGNLYAVLTMPECRLAAVPLPQPTLTPGGRVDFMLDVTHVVAGGRAIVEKTEPKSGKLSWWMTPGTRSDAGAALIPLEPPPSDSGDGRPILSDDGHWVAWLERIPNSDPPGLHRVFLRPDDPKKGERIIDLTAAGPSTYLLKSVSVTSEELMLWKRDRLILAGFDGRVKKEFAQPAAARPQANTYLPSGDHWLAWDAYRENDRYILEWSLPFGAGSHRVPLGRTIHAADFDPSGKWIAVSAGTSLNIGKARDAVYILSSADGREVFRKYLPPFTRSPVAFLDGGYVAYTDRGGVRVLRAP